MRRSQFCFRSLRHLVVQQEMDGPDFVRVQAAGVLDGASGGQVQAVYEHEHDVAAQDGHFGRFQRALLELLRLRAVLVVEAYERQCQQREQDDDRPCALGELGDDEDPHDDPGQDGGAQVDSQLALPPSAPVGQVVLAHARPGHGETGENADRINGDEGRDVGAG